MQNRMVVTSNGRSLMLQGVYFQGTHYRLYQSQEAHLVVKVYDQGYDKFLLTETQAIRLLKTNPNLPTFLEGSMGATKVLLFEKCHILQNILREQSQGLEEPQVLKILLDLCRAANYCHQQGVTHRDIRPENVLIGFDKQAKLCNFQRSTFQTYNTIPTEYVQRVREEINQNTYEHIRAPEQNDPQLRHPITEKVDIYAIGQLVYYMIYNCKYDCKNPQFQPKPVWGMYSENLQQIVRMCLTPTPQERPSAKQVEQAISNLITPTNTTVVHIRSRSSNERANRELASQRGERDKFNGIEFAELQPQQQESSLYTRFVKQVSKFSNKTEGWVIACLEEVDDGPKQKYLRYLIVKAWNKRNKVCKFYTAVAKQLGKLGSVIVTFKILLLMHNYIKKGPIEALILEHKEYAPMPILEKIKELQLANSMKSSKDKVRTPYINSLLTNYSMVVLEKLKLCVYYKSFFEGNYSMTPFFNNMAKQAVDPIKIPMVMNLLNFWQKLNQFSQKLVGEQNLIRLQFALCLTMVDELYNLLSVCTHLVYAIKHSSNYAIEEGNFIQIKNIVIQMQDLFVKNYVETLQFFQSVDKIPQFKSTIPQPSKSVIDTIKSIPVLQQVKGEFNIFDYLSYTNSIDGIKIPLSYGEAISTIKIENDEQETISLQIQDENFGTIHPIVESQLSSRPQTERTSIKNEQMDTVVKQPQIQSEPYIKNEFQDFFKQQTTKPQDIKISDIKKQKKARNSNNEYQDLSFSDDEDGPSQRSPLETPIHKAKIAQMKQDDFLAMPSPSPKKLHQSPITQRIQSATDNANLNVDFLQAPFPQQSAPQPQKENIFNQFIPQQNYFKPQPQPFELYTFIQQELKSNASDWVIQFNQLTLDKQIGTGSSCDVYKGYWRGSEVAIKKMKIKSLSENHLKEFRREITALVTIKPHANLVQLMGISQKDDDLYIVTEFCAGGTVFDLLHRRKNIDIPWPARIRMALHIAQGMSYLHELNPPLIHRDLKSLNLLLESQYDIVNPFKVNIKIADFGLARAQLDNGEAMTGVLGTFHWMAPEIFESLPYTTKADVFSFGIVLWEMCARETPYKSFGTPHAIMKYVTIDKGRPDLNLLQMGCPLLLKDLMIKCWDHDASRRPRFVDVISILRT